MDQEINHHRQELKEKYDLEFSNYYPIVSKNLKHSILDYQQMKIIQLDQFSIILLQTQTEGNQDYRLQIAEQLVQHQMKINSRLRNLHCDGILVDIIQYEIHIVDQFEYTICKCMKLQEISTEIQYQDKLGIANCLNLYIGLELKGIIQCSVILIEDLHVIKILPFTYLKETLNEYNPQLLIYNDCLVKFKQLSNLNEIQQLKYLELNYGLGIADILKRSKVSIVDEKTKFLNQNDEMIAYSFEFEVFKGKVYANFQIKDRIHKFEGEWNANHHLINQQIDEINFDEIPIELFEKIDNSELAAYNHYEFQYKNSLIFLQCKKIGDLKNKVIKISKSIKRQYWYLALSELLKMMSLYILNVTYVDQKLYLRTLCKLQSPIPTSSVEIQADVREEDFNLILDQCNTNNYIELLNIEGSNFRDSLLQGLTSGGFLKGIKEVCFKGCPFITDDGISLLSNFGVQKLDISHTQTKMTLPQGLIHLNLAYSKFDAESLIQIFRQRHSIHLNTLDISGIGTDQLMQEIFNSQYKDLRNLYANNCNLSLLTFKYISESKYIQKLDVLSLQGSLVDIQKGMFKKSNQNLLGSISQKSMIIKLDLSNCLIGDKLMQSLVQGQRVLSNLRVLSLSGCKAVTDKTIQLLCDAPKAITQNLKSLDISNLPLITEYSLEYLVYKGLLALTDLNIADSQQLKVEDLKRSFESGKFNQIKCLAISGINEWGGQAEVFKFGIPELCAFFVKNYLPELQIIEIYIQSKNFKNIISIVSNLIYSQVLTKVISQEEIVLDEGTIQTIRANNGSERLLINNRPIVKQEEVQGDIQLVNYNQFYECLFAKKQAISINQQEIQYLKLIYNFKSIKNLILKKTEILDSDMENICKNLIITQLNVKKCKKLTNRSFQYIIKQSETLTNLDIRGTVFDKTYQTLKLLANFQQLTQYNNGKLFVQILNTNQLKNINIGIELKHIPEQWMQLEFIRYFHLEVKAKQIQTFKFLLKTLTLLLYKNQDHFQQLKVNLQDFKIIEEKSILLFNNSLLNLNKLNLLEFGFENMKNVSFLMIKNLILTLSQLPHLKILTLNLNNCIMTDIDQELLSENMVFEDLRVMRLKSFTFQANDTITQNQQCFNSLFQYLSDIDTLKYVTISLARQQIQQETLFHLFESLKVLTLYHLSLNFEQTAEYPYSRDIWAKILDVLRSNNSLVSVELNFNHDFELTDIDLHNIIDAIYSMKLQSCQISLIGCYHNERKIKNIVKEEMKNYYFYI